ncbi:hypothetical protein [Undibacterium sp. TS12]|uniref:hypothetical protein n=1 Tax=Undibacterium sp. TS12 TaxID=2908202 RepID=UPI001F4D1F38|nr:hypothetical protein [Undibacterium sp. TS12]MCH8622972.1 hypothetical protein [Undibacterium sp. TS12]
MPRCQAGLLPGAAGSEIIARRLELMDLLAREEGKTLAEASDEVMLADYIINIFADEVLRAGGECAGSVEGQCPPQLFQSAAARRPDCTPMTLLL